MYWIWQSLRTSDDQARISGRPRVISDHGIRFDQGIKLDRSLPTIEIIRDEDSQGRLTDHQLAPGTTGLLFSSRLRQVLARAGVDNIDYYPVSIINPADGSQSNDYQLANLIGRVHCFDLANSVVEFHSGSNAVQFIESLALDESRIGDLRLFRAAENSQVMIVHDKVKIACESAGMTGIVFSLPQDYIL